jgi:hypothetical protein
VEYSRVDATTIPQHFNADICPGYFYHAANLRILLAVMHCISALRVNSLKPQNITVSRKQADKFQLEMAGIGFADLTLTAFRHREEIPSWQ